MTLNGLSRNGWDGLDDNAKMDICKKSINMTNIVSTITFNSMIPVKEMAKRNPGILYHPLFGSVSFKLLSPSVTVTLYSTGVGVFMGANDSLKVILASCKICMIVNRNMPPAHAGVNIISLDVHNVVASVLAFPVDVNILLKNWKHAIECHSGFTGITLLCSNLNMGKPTTIVMEIFADSGKIIITGAKTKEEIPEVYKFVHEHILIPAELKRSTTGPTGAPSSASGAKAKSGYSHKKRRTNRDGDDDDDDDEEEEEEDDEDDMGMPKGDDDDEEGLEQKIARDRHISETPINESIKMHKMFSGLFHDHQASNRMEDDPEGEEEEDKQLLAAILAVNHRTHST